MSNYPFPLVDAFTGEYFETDLATLVPGETLVVPTWRRLTPEKSYSHVHALWWAWLADGRSIISVPPGAEDEIRAVVAEVRVPKELHEPALAELLTDLVNRALREARRSAITRHIHELWFACDRQHLVRHHRGDCRRLIDMSIPHAEGFYLPDHCFPGAESPDDLGTAVYGVVADEQVVSVAYAHRTGIMENRVAEIGVATHGPYQGRGFAQTCVSSLIGEMVLQGGEARYGCSVVNTASQATARSVGCVPYATVLELHAPRTTGELAGSW